MSSPNPFFRRVIAASLSISLFSASVAPSFARAAPASSGPGDGWDTVKGQIAADLVQGGITVAASLTGNIPLALLAGIVGKYITSYGIQGVRSLIDALKGYPPQDLGEVNLAYMYLIHIKRNLYSTLISIRKAAEAGVADDPNLSTELDSLEKDVTALCGAGNCDPVTVDDKLVNYSFLQVALDAKESLNVNQWLSTAEIKNTYQYLLLLYLDLVMTEQQLMQTQNLVIGQQVKDTVAALRANHYISDAEKEYQAQMVLNIALRWQKMLDERRVLVSKVMTKPLEDIQKENQDIQKQLNDLKKKQTPPPPAPEPSDDDSNSDSSTIWGSN